MDELAVFHKVSPKEKKKIVRKIIIHQKKATPKHNKEDRTGNTFLHEIRKNIAGDNGHLILKG